MRNRKREDDDEIFVGRRSSAGGYPRVHLLYPNSYQVGMSSLALQALYRCFCDSGCAVERIFRPDKGRWRTYEEDRPLCECDIVACTISFEGDYLSVVQALSREGLLDARTSRPLLLAGGAAVTLNPEPLAPLFDLFCIGEAEEFIPELVELVREGNRESLLRAASKIEGAYVPALVHVQYEGEGVKSIEFEQGVSRPKRRYVKDLERFPTASQVLTERTEFSSMFLAETGRGCENGCKFCAAGYLYRPIRKQKAHVLSAMIREGLAHAQKVGLVGAAVSSHPALLDLCRQAAQAGGRASLSSLMAYRMNPELGAELRRMGTRSVAVAPEAGSERLRYFVGKRVRDEVFVEASKELAQSGVTELKLYFMIGLPTETDADVEAIVSLSDAIASQPQRLRCTLSVSPFIPKPCTPFQWKRMEVPTVLERRLALLKSLAGRTKRLRVSHESLRESEYQALLSRADRRIAPVLQQVAATDGSWRDVLKSARTATPSLDSIVYREYDPCALLPWDVVDSRISKELLIREAEREYRPRPDVCEGGRVARPPKA